MTRIIQPTDPAEAGPYVCRAIFASFSTSAFSDQLLPLSVCLYSDGCSDYIMLKFIAVFPYGVEEKREVVIKIAMNMDLTGKTKSPEVVHFKKSRTQHLCITPPTPLISPAIFLFCF